MNAPRRHARPEPLHLPKQQPRSKPGVASGNCKATCDQWSLPLKKKGG